MRIQNFDNFLTEGNNLKKELLKMGYDKKELSQIQNFAINGELGKFLQSEGKDLTFGILNAIYLDSIELHRNYELKKGGIKALVRAIPMALSPVSVLVSYVGMAFGGTRAANKILKPILENPSRNYPEFLKKLISKSMSVVEGEISGDDPIKMAFVVSDGLVDMLNPNVVYNFTIHLSEKMSKENPNGVVPDYYVENELRSYLNDKFSLNPQLPMKQD
jgi:hypothetical protein